MTTKIEKLRAEIEEKTRKFLESGGAIDVRRTGEVGLGRLDKSDLRAATMTLQEVATASGLAEETIKSLTYQKKMPQASMYLDRTVIWEKNIRFKHLRWKRAEIEAWLTERAAKAAKQKERLIARTQRMNKADSAKPNGALWIEEVAKLIGVSPKTVQRRANSGKLRKPDGYAGVRPFWYAKNIK